MSNSYKKCPTYMKNVQLIKPQFEKLSRQSDVLGHMFGWVPRFWNKFKKNRDQSVKATRGEIYERQCIIILK